MATIKSDRTMGRVKASVLAFVLLAAAVAVVLVAPPTTMAAPTLPGSTG